MSTTGGGLPSTFLETVHKILPKNIDGNKLGNPVIFSEFQAATNVEEEAINAMKTVNANNFEIYLNNKDVMLAQQYCMYKNFYTSEEERNKYPAKNIQIKDYYPRELHYKFLKFRRKPTTNGVVPKIQPNFPVSFDFFMKHTNLQEVLEDNISLDYLMDPKKVLEFAKSYYFNYYAKKNRDSIIYKQLQVRSEHAKLITTMPKWHTDLDIFDDDETIVVRDVIISGVRYKVVIE